MNIIPIIPQYSYEILSTNRYDIGAEYHIQLRITEACDLQCEYCHWHGGKHYDFEDIIASINSIFTFLKKQNIKSVHFYYHGGEATRHNKLLNILKHIKECAVSSNITAYNELQTNLTLKTELLESLLPYFDLMSISFHYMELIKRPYKLQAFQKNFEYLKSNNKAIQNFDIMLELIPEENLENYHELILSFLEYENIVNSEMIYGYYDFTKTQQVIEQHKSFYDAHNKTEQLYLIDDVKYNTSELFTNSLDCRGWKCDAGKKTLYVNGDGNVFVCAEPTTRFIKQNSTEIPYTNLITDSSAISKLSILSKSGTICKWNVCAGDFYIDRIKK